MVVENGEGVNVLPTKATPTEDEYEPLTSLDVLNGEVEEALELVSSEVLNAVIEEVVEVTVLVTVPGVGVT
jgi:NTP pyrophosphatase (non-canonical NTP hydrolase)